MHLPEDEHTKRAILNEFVRRFGRATEKKRPWCPQKPHPKQKVFLDLTCREALYGGAAGGGKTSCLLMDALKYVHVPDYTALILRRSYMDLAMPDAVMDRARQWLTGTDARYNPEQKKWVFPSGAILKFGYLEHDNDLDKYQGAAFHFVGFDEITQFTERQYLYLLSRNRRLKGSQIPLRVRATGNPGGRGHQWVYDRFVRDDRVHQTQFVPATLEDNPSLDQETYRQNLEQLDSTTRAQLLLGLWIQDSTGLIYPYEDSKNGVDDYPERNMEKILSIDFGASLSKPTTAFAVSGFQHTDPSSVWCLESYAMPAMIPTTIAEEINIIKERHGITRVVADAGALGVGYIEEIKRRHHIWIEPAKKTDKRGFRKLLRGDMERGAFKVVRETNRALIKEMQVLCWDEHGIDTAKGAEDHLTDAMLYAWREARYFQSRVPEVVPKPGTKERYDWEEKKIEEYMSQDPEKKNKRYRGGFNYVGI